MFFLNPLRSDKRWEFDYVESLKRIAQESAAAATDSALSLVMIHFPAPHSCSSFLRG
jgi:hypothetical protein